VKSFPRNTEIEAVLEFTSKDPHPMGGRIADSRAMQHRWRYSISALPEAGYMPRLADDRIGHFITMYQDYTDVDGDSPYVRYVNRWRLEKRDPDAEISEPVEPIVYWIENSVPERYRAAVREGVLLWNDAFERIGYRNAIVVKQQPDDAEWDPADVRYNTIRWMVMPGRAYAVGPSEADPFTGEIYSADVRLSADYIRAFFNQYEEFSNPLEISARYIDGADPELGDGERCAYAEGKAMEAAFGAELLAARTFTGDPTSEEARKYAHDGLVDLVVHEVGHTLGLRHNFRASTIHTLDEVHDTDVTRAEGVSGSVMDYNPVNIAPKGRDQGSMWCTNLGAYDYLAIEYAYAPIEAETPEGERAALEKIAEKSTEPRYVYGTDDDAFGLSAKGLDPYTTPYDLGSDPIRFYRERLELTDELLSITVDAFEQEGARYPKMRRVVSRAMRNYYRAASTIPKFIGGISQYRDHVGDPGARIPLQPVATSVQRDALAFLNTEIFAEDAFVFSPDLVRRLAPERMPDFVSSSRYDPQVDYPFHETVLGIQRTALSRLFHPIKLNRLVDMPLYAGDDDVLDLHEVMSALTDAIWSEIDAGRSVSSFRRNLQREHLDRMLSLVVRPQGSPYYSLRSGGEPAGTVDPPADARTLARAELIELAAAMDRVLDGGEIDVPTRAHLDESRARIRAALEAQVSRQP
jgi:hypothetical protein